MVQQTNTNSEAFSRKEIYWITETAGEKHFQMNSDKAEESLLLSSIGT